MDYYQRRILPHNTQAEQAVLGSIFLKNSTLSIAMTYLKPSDFFSRDNRIIFGDMCKLSNEDSSIDKITLFDMLKNQASQFDTDNIFKYASDLITLVPTASNIKYYAKIVQNKSLARKLIKVARGIQNEGFKSNVEPSQMLDDAESRLLTISRNDSKDGLQPVSKITKLSFQRLKDLQKNHSGVTGEPTGFHFIDKMTTGLHDGEFIVIAARPAMGKTTMALNIANNVANLTHKAVAIFSLEMRSQDLVNRLLCSGGYVDAMHVREGNLNTTEANHLVLAASQLTHRHIFIDDTPGINISSILARSRRLSKQCKGNLGLIVVDYLQLVEGIKSPNRQQVVSQISRQLKKLALALNVPVIALSQLSRSVEQRENKKPVLSDLRESGSIEQDADIVAFLYRKDYYQQKENERKNSKDKNQTDISKIKQKPEGDPSITDFIIEKNRSGPRGDVKLMFFKAYNKFSTIDTRKFVSKE